VSEDPVAVVRRWLDSGGETRVLGTSGDDLVVGLFTCDGGEEMGRVVGPGSSLRDLVDRP
jgi:hypothetical protein